LKLYKFKLRATPVICNDIEKNAVELKNSMEKLESLSIELSELFKPLKKEIPESEKLHVQQVKLKEKKPGLKDLYEKEKILRMNQHITEKIDRMLKELSLAIRNIKAITLDADALIYKEEKYLNSVAYKIEKAKADNVIEHELINRINEVKQDMKTVTRRLYEVSRAQEKNLLTPVMDKPARIALSEQIRELSVDIAKVQHVLSTLKVSDIDSITKNAEKELNDLRKIELDVEILVPRIDRYLNLIRNKLHFLEDDFEAKVKKDLIRVIKQFNSTKEQITEQAELLFQEIKILE
jgi:hypothetical protein